MIDLSAYRDVLNLFPAQIQGIPFELCIQEDGHISPRYGGGLLDALLVLHQFKRRKTEFSLDEGYKLAAYIKLNAEQMGVHDPDAKFFSQLYHKGLHPSEIEKIHQLWVTDKDHAVELLGVITAAT